MVARGTFARERDEPGRDRPRGDVDQAEGVQSRLPAAPARTEGEAVGEPGAGEWITGRAERGWPWPQPGTFSILRAAAR